MAAMLLATSYRFTKSLDWDHLVQAMRLFVGEPIWTPINRPADEHTSRKKYVEGFLNQSHTPVSVK